MKRSTFLVEIGMEELPPKILRKLGRDFCNKILFELNEMSISYNKVCWFVSSCHVAVKLEIEIQDHQDINDSEITFVDREFEKKINIDKDITFNISKKNDTKINNTSNVCVIKDNAKIIKKSNNFQDLLFTVVSNALRKLNNYEMMRWGAGISPFLRPVHTITILLDSHLICGSFFEVSVDRILLGNKCIKKNRIVIEHANCYPEILQEEGWIIVDYNKRKEIICSEIEKESAKLGGWVDLKNDDLVEEVTASIEWPVVLSGRFDVKFLKIPKEVILHILRYDHRYFPVYATNNGVLMPFFIFVANIVSNNYKHIIAGHEKAITPRLLDAEVFLKHDSFFRLEEYIPKLSSVLFHRKLGSLRDKSFRIKELSGWIAEQINVDVQQAKRAGYLCKCDLMSNMVFEFPFTQGIIGMYYALRDGETEKIAVAQRDHYKPRFSLDILPESCISCAVAIADRIDTIVGIFGIKEFPKGNRDPFALKRAAIGIIRIIIQKKILLNLCALIRNSAELYGNWLINRSVIDDVCVFIYKRLCSWYMSKGYRFDIIRSVLAIKNYNLVDIDTRINAVSVFCSLYHEESVRLSLIYKRVSNILKNKISLDSVVVHVELLTIPEEIQLANQVFLIEKEIRNLIQEYRYKDIFMLLVQLFGTIDEFFKTIVVMNKELIIQNNRLSLLCKIRNLFLQIADFSMLN